MTNSWLTFSKGGEIEPMASFYHLVAPEGFEISPETRDFLTKKGALFKESRDIREVVEDCDLGYFTRVQKNRLRKNKRPRKERRALAAIC